jgi:subtilisin family serine protease
MRMTNKPDITRRGVLQTVGAGLGTAGIATTVAGAGGRGEYLVGFRDGADVTAATTRAAGATRQFDFDDIGTVVAARFEEDDIRALESNSDVRYVERNGPMKALEAKLGQSDVAGAQETVPYGIELTEADTAIDQGATGAGTTIAVVDTGVDADHETLAENIVDGYAAEQCSDTDCDTDWDDDQGHGTHVAGTAAAALNGVGVYGVAPDADLLAVKVLGPSGGSFASVAEGIEWSVNNGADVINLSLGGPESQAVSDAVQYAADNDVIVISAAGNAGPCSDCVNAPANNPNAVAVSATDSSDNLASFSSTGSEVEIAAPGAAVNSSYPDDQYQELSGTSMASPHVAGAAAAVLSTGTAPGDVVPALKDGAEDIGLGGNEQGSGRLNVLNAIEDDGGGGDPPSENVEVTTDSATSVGETTATLNGTLTTVEGADTATVFFEYGPVGSGFPEATGSGDFGAGTSFSADVSGLQDGTTYEFRAVASTQNASDDGSAATFETDSSGGGCFITTATANETETLDSLRRFRDDSMKTTPVGKGLVGLYYRISPPIARTLDRHPDSTEAAVTRGLVDRCASLSDTQAETDSRVKSATLGVMLTVLYIVGIMVGALGHASLRTRELLR